MGVSGVSGLSQFLMGTLEPQEDVCDGMCYRGLRL